MPQERLNIALKGETMLAIGAMAEQLHMNRADVIEVIIAVYFKIVGQSKQIKRNKGGCNL